MFCRKCGNPLPNVGFTCKFCGAMMDKGQIEMQKKLMKERKIEPKLKSELYGMEKIDYQKKEESNSKNNYLGIIFIGTIIIFLIILAILLNRN